MQTQTMTEAEAQKHGYSVRRGAYYGTPDDRADRWYIDHEDADYLDRRGPGHRTKREALEAVTERVASNA